MDALYAFMRLSDDLADEPGGVALKRERLRAWRAGLLAAIGGTFSHPVHPALIDVVRRYEVPTQLLFDVLDGVEADVEPSPFATFADLYPYCYRVASAVGLACVRVWGFSHGGHPDDAIAAAEAAGVAFQLTNVLRDLGEDLDHARVYLPTDELIRFACLPDTWRDVATTSRFQELMQFQLARAKDYFQKAEPLGRLLSSDGRAIFRVMAGTYRRLLEEIERDVRGVLTRRVRVPRWRKGLIMLDGWAAKWGWV
jgi:phytoene synthase